MPVEENVAASCLNLSFGADPENHYEKSENGVGFTPLFATVNSSMKPSICAPHVAVLRILSLLNSIKKINPLTLHKNAGFNPHRDHQPG
jgi:hypothetical protein